MKLSGKFLLIILSLSIISYGMSSSVYASSHSIPPVSISTDKASYATGDAILLSGFVKDYDGEFGLTIMIVNPQGNVVYAAQPVPNADGNYSVTAIASGMIKKVGEYVVKVNYGPQSNQTIFEFIGGEGSVQASEPQEAPLARFCLASPKSIFLTKILLDLPQMDSSSGRNSRTPPNE